MSISKFESWMWSYLGIIVEALPFLLIGAVLSAIIQIYVSDDFIKKIIPAARLELALLITIWA